MMRPGGTERNRFPSDGTPGAESERRGEEGRETQLRGGRRKNRQSILFVMLTIVRTDSFKGFFTQNALQKRDRAEQQAEII
jgi:hypothetical protein